MAPTVGGLIDWWLSCSSSKPTLTFTLRLHFPRLLPSNELPWWENQYRSISARCGTLSMGDTGSRIFHPPGSNFVGTGLQSMSFLTQSLFLPHHLSRCQICIMVLRISSWGSLSFTFFRYSPNKYLTYLIPS